MRNVIRLLLNEKVQQEQDIMGMKNNIAESATDGLTLKYLRKRIKDKEAFIAEIQMALELLKIYDYR